MHLIAKKMASEKGIMLNNLVGTGDGGRIIKRDIENYSPILNNKNLKKNPVFKYKTLKLEKQLQKDYQIQNFLLLIII